jgi:hypothetical protein
MAGRSAPRPPKAASSLRSCRRTPNPRCVRRVYSTELAVRSVCRCASRPGIAGRRACAPNGSFGTMNMRNAALTKSSRTPCRAGHFLQGQSNSFRNKNDRRQSKNNCFQSNNDRLWSDHNYCQVGNNCFQGKNNCFWSKHNHWRSKTNCFQINNDCFRSKHHQCRSKNDRFQSKTSCFWSKESRHSSASGNDMLCAGI